jgi:hypothetical protein
VATASRGSSSHVKQQRRYAGTPVPSASAKTSLLGEIRQFFAERIFGPERRALLAAQVPVSEAEAAASAPPPAPP